MAAAAAVLRVIASATGLSPALAVTSANRAIGALTVRPVRELPTPFAGARATAHAMTASMAMGSALASRTITATTVKTRTS